MNDADERAPSPPAPTGDGTPAGAWLTAETPGIGGHFKAVPEDFRVEELPRYPASGAGTHTYLKIEKRGIATFEAVRRLARALDVDERNFGIPGLKDARAVTIQWVSIEHVPPERALGIALQGVRVLEVARHTNKLRRGHLSANRFTCVLREIDPAGEPRARAILDRLTREGVPNAFGHQRFGDDGSTHRLGLALVKGDAARVMQQLLGDAERERDPQRARARAAFDAGELETARKAWPARNNLERRALKFLCEPGATPESALRAIPKKLKRLYVSALQSWLFNHLLAARLAAGTLARLECGDIAYKHDSGGAFVVEDAAAEQPRADAFAISPSGPLVAPKSLLAEGAPGARERAVLAKAGLTPEDFALSHGLAPAGARRPYRQPLGEPALDFDAAACTATVRFTLPPGTYATLVLAELIKHEPAFPTYAFRLPIWPAS